MLRLATDTDNIIRVVILFQTEGPENIILNHVQRGSAKHSVKGGLAFLWEMRFSTPFSSAPNVPIKMAFGTLD